MKCECSPFSYVSKPQLDRLAPVGCVSVESSQNVRTAVGPDDGHLAVFEEDRLLRVAGRSRRRRTRRSSRRCRGRGPPGCRCGRRRLHPGCARSMTAIPYVPSTTARALRTASARSSVPAVAMRWARTSESVSDANLPPAPPGDSRIGVRVLDDPVVHDGDPPGRVGVRVGVDVARLAVGRPPGVADAGAEVGGGQVHRPKGRDLPFRLDDRQPFVGLDGDARGVVAAVLEPLEAFDQDRYRAAFPDVSDDAAHGRQTRCVASRQPVKPVGGR